MSEVSPVSSLSADGVVAPLTTRALFGGEALAHTLAAPLLQNTVYPWQALADLADFIRALGPTLPADIYAEIAPQVWAARDVTIAATASITGPTILGPGTEVRPGAYIRGSVLVGANAVVGNSTELKNVILFDRVQVPHYNYVGDSILGFGAHLGAGAITSNVKGDKTPVTVHCPDGAVDTGRKKLGAILAAGAEVGCNTVLNPGSVLGEGCRVYPLCRVRGYIPPRHICTGDGPLRPIRP